MCETARNDQKRKKTDLNDPTKKEEVSAAQKMPSQKLLHMWDLEPGYAEPVDSPRRRRSKEHIYESIEDVRDQLSRINLSQIRMRRNLYRRSVTLQAFSAPGAPAPGAEMRRRSVAVMQEEQRE